MPEKTISLGKQLVAELDRESHADFLCQWMAHYLAEQITLAENTTGQKKAAAEKKCFETILALWKHRASFPGGHRPFENFEPVLDALYSLDPANPQPYYHRFRPANQTTNTKEPKEVLQLIDLVFAVDSAARVLVNAALSELTKLAVTPGTKKMLQNSPKSAKADATTAIKILIHQMESPEPGSDLGNRLIVEQLQKLQAFSDTCKILEKMLKQRMQKSAPLTEKK